MIFGAHVIVFSNDASADRAFFRDVFDYPSVDAGGDWLIFELPPAASSRCIPPMTNEGMSCISCVTTFKPKSPPSQHRVCELRKSKKRDGVRSQRFNSQAGAQSASTNRNTQQR